MAGETPTITEVPTPDSGAPSPAPASVAAPVATETAPPNSTAQATPATESPKVEATEAPKVDGADKPATEVTEPPAAEPSQAETPSADAPEPAEPAAPKYEFKLPDGIKADADVIGAYSNILAKANVPPEIGQELIDFYGSRMKAEMSAIEQRQRDVWAETNKNWIKGADKAFGNRRDTYLSEAKWLIDNFGGTKEQKAETYQVLALTGAGNHASVIRTLANAARKFRERNAPAPGIPKSGAQASTPYDRRYGSRT